MHLAGSPMGTQPTISPDHSVEGSKDSQEDIYILNHEQSAIGFSFWIFSCAFKICALVCGWP